VGDDRCHQRAGKLGCRWIALDLREVALEDRLCGPLPELGLEDSRQRETASGPPGAHAVRGLPASARGRHAAPADAWRSAGMLDA
jgi:hypothetical protein